MQVGKSRKIRENHCLSCNYKMDSCSSIGCDATPKDGDITMCIECGYIMAFDKDLLFRDLTDSEIIEIAGDPRIVKTQNAIKQVKQQKDNAPR